VSRLAVVAVADPIVQATAALTIGCSGAAIAHETILRDWSVPLGLSRTAGLAAMAAGAFVSTGAVVVVSRRISASGIRGASGGIIASLLIHSGAFLLHGLGAWLVVRHVSQASSPTFVDVTTAWCLAWVVGFVTPGAPAGLGVRDALLVGTLTAMHVEGAVTAAVVLRIATTFADLIVAASNFTKFRHTFFTRRLTR
jgi:hypothetical protein